MNLKQSSGMIQAINKLDSEIKALKQQRVLQIQQTSNTQPTTVSRELKGKVKFREGYYQAYLDARK